MNTAAAAPTEAILRATGRREHPGCFACGDPVAGGLGLKFQIAAPAGVEARWMCLAMGESYPGIMHGGVVATLLDAAMVHALFARGITARTGELRIRYRRPVCSGRPVTVRGWLVRACGPLFMLQAELQQDAVLCAEARAKFMQTPGAGEPVGRAGVVRVSRPPRP